MPPYDPDYDYGSSYSQHVTLENTLRGIKDRAEKDAERDRKYNDAFAQRNSGLTPVVQQAAQPVEISESTKKLVKHYNASLAERKAKRDQQHKNTDELFEAVHEHQKHTH